MIIGFINLCIIHIEVIRVTLAIRDIRVIQAIRVLQVILRCPQAL